MVLQWPLYETGTDLNSRANDSLLLSLAAAAVPCRNKDTGSESTLDTLQLLQHHVETWTQVLRALQTPCSRSPGPVAGIDYTQGLVHARQVLCR